MVNPRVVILGGGAAGFFGAIACAETNHQARVTLLEKGAHVLSKVRVSGGGRCNVTHACYDPKLLVKNYPRGMRALLGPLHAFQPKDMVAWLESRGVALKTEDDGRIFPTTDTSLTIINAFKEAAKNAGVKVRTQTFISSAEKRAGGGFFLRLNTGESVECDRLLLASGSAASGHSLAVSFGHTIVPPVPSLFTFNIPDKRLKDLAGVSVSDACVKISGTALEQSGPLLITHWGLSGPAVLKLSAWGARVLNEKQYHAAIQVNWIAVSAAEAGRQLMEFKTANAKKTVAAHPLLGMPRRLWERLCVDAGLNATVTWADVSKIQMARVARALTASEYTIRGKTTFKEEFVTAGGVNLDEVNFKTMESKLQPGLHLAGEILDIDGVTGGFNFQSAWTTAWLAGRAVAKA